jgi:hypothetical protein
MKTTKKHSLEVALFLFLFLFIISCNQNSTPKDPPEERLNTFEMKLNGEVWKPSTINSNDCMRSFMCNMSEIAPGPFYKIESYKDPLSKTNLTSENFFEIEIMNVNATGIYFIDEQMGDFKNYARFRINDTNGKRIYENKENSTSFAVEITGFNSIKNSILKGITGSFYGTLYNTENELDSLQIEGGEFIFKKINWYNFNQCKE